MISIIVNNYGRSYLLPLVMQCYNRSVFKGEPIEMVIIDDNSPEPFEEYLKLALQTIHPYFNVRAFQTHNQGSWTNPGITANLGVKQSKGDVIILNPSDMIPFNPYTLQVVSEYHRSHPMTHLSSTEIPLTHTSWSEGKYPTTGGELSLPGSSMPRSLFDKIGGFDERFRTYGHEDADILWRIYYGAEDLGIHHDHHKELFYLHLSPAHVLLNSPAHELLKQSCTNNDGYVRENMTKRNWVVNPNGWGVWPKLTEILSYHGEMN